MQSQLQIHTVQLSLLNRTAQQLDRRDFRRQQISCQKMMKKNRNLMYTTTQKEVQGFSRTSIKFSLMTSNHRKRKRGSAEDKEAKVGMILVGKRRQKSIQPKRQVFLSFRWQVKMENRTRRTIFVEANRHIQQSLQKKPRFKWKIIREQIQKKLN